MISARFIGMVVAALLLACGAYAQSSDDGAGNISKDIVGKMGATAAYTQLRSIICGDADARSRATPAVLRALNCGQVPVAGSDIPRAVLSGSSAAATVARGVWTTKGREYCATSHYTWTVDSGIAMSEFVDQAGQIDIERTREIGDNSITTETLASYHPIDGHHEQIGTRWLYTFIDGDHVQVRNMRTGLTFNLTRCSK
jgi:hypothetical protein